MWLQNNIGSKSKRREKNYHHVRTFWMKKFSVSFSEGKNNLIDIVDYFFAREIMKGLYDILYIGVSLVF